MTHTDGFLSSGRAHQQQEGLNGRPGCGAEGGPQLPRAARAEGAWALGTKTRCQQSRGQHPRGHCGPRGTGEGEVSEPRMLCGVLGPGPPGSEVRSPSTQLVPAGRYPSLSSCAPGRWPLGFPSFGTLYEVQGARHISGPGLRCMRRLGALESPQGAAGVIAGFSSDSVRPR